MPCPWYQQGYCTSPKIGVPTDVVVSPDRCLDDSRYRQCSYYVEPGTKSRKEVSVAKEKLKVYAPIHALLRDLKCGCPYIQILQLSGVKVAYCRALDRLLTRYEAELCETNWKNCPYRIQLSELSSV